MYKPNQTKLAIKSIDDLKSLGSFKEVKWFIESKIGLKLGVNGWDKLFIKITMLAMLLNKNRAELEDFIFQGHNKETTSFSKTKNYFSDLLNIQIKARNWEELDSKLKGIMVIIPQFYIYKQELIFEKNKIKNFINSSKLEGIYIHSYLIDKDMEQILNKYRNKING